MIAVIGDIHGCFYTLVDLFNEIKQKYSSIPIYCVGDIVDRGNHSFEAMKFIIDKKIKFTPGNHDYMFYHFFKDPASIFARSWVFNGNEATISSYEEHEEAVFEHIKVIKNAPLYFNLSDCFISHAGISAHYKNFLPDDFQNDLNQLKDLIYNDYKNESGVLWNRDELLNLGKLQVVGHSKQKEIVFVEESNSVYIDTGAFVGNKLSAVIIHQNDIVDALEVKTVLSDII